MKLYESFKDKIVLFVSELNKEKIASSFFLLDDDKLFGRYWGSLGFSQIFILNYAFISQ